MEKAYSSDLILINRGLFNLYVSFFHFTVRVKTFQLKILHLKYLVTFFKHTIQFNGYEFF